MSRPKSSRITADQVADVRNVLGETQDEFAQRFSRSRFTIIRWEQNGVKFKYATPRERAWRRARGEAQRLTQGTDDDAEKNLRTLFSFSP